MTLQNRVLPTGEITTQPFYGTLMGNRGILHGADQRLKTARWSHLHWVTCRLHYKDVHRPMMTPGNYTELFFLDECTALAAGHRPCGLCRHKDFSLFKQAFMAANTTRNLTGIDRLMHQTRVLPNRAQRRYQAPIQALPDGTFILHQGAPWLLWRTHLLLCEDGAYTSKIPRPTHGPVTVLTPAPTVAALAHGYRPAIHQSAHLMLPL